MIEQSELFDDPINSEATRSIELTEAITARRRAAFWRKIVPAIAGLAVVIVVVSWQRSRSLVSNCESSLLELARAAKQQDLAARPTAIIEADWALLDGGKNTRPGHYHVIAENWLVTPDAGQAVPLAVCQTAHGFLSAQGRHVLFNTPDGYKVRWVPEDKAGPLAKDHRD